MKVLPEVKAISLKKMMKKTWSKIWKLSRRNINCSLEKPAKYFGPKLPAENFLPKTSCQNPKTIVQIPENVKSLVLLKKTVFSKNFALDTKS